MKSWLKRAEAILRGQPDSQNWPLVLACGLFYGSVMGSYGGRGWQICYSAIKMPILLTATLFLSLPSYFVLNTLMGVRSDFGAAWRGIVASQAGLTIILVSLAPITAFWYSSSTNYRSAIFFNALMFAIASLGAQIILRRAYRPLIARDPRHRWLLRTWIVLYAFVGIQMGWNLRPFIGAPSEPVRFFREGAWGNAYVEVAKMFWELVSR